MYLKMEYCMLCKLHNCDGEAERSNEEEEDYSASRMTDE